MKQQQQHIHGTFKSFPTYNRHNKKHTKVTKRSKTYQKLTVKISQRGLCQWSKGRVDARANRETDHRLCREDRISSCRRRIREYNEGPHAQLKDMLCWTWTLSNNDRLTSLSKSLCERACVTVTVSVSASCLVIQSKLNYNQIWLCFRDSPRPDSCVNCLRLGPTGLVP